MDHEICCLNLFLESEKLFPVPKKILLSVGVPEGMNNTLWLDIKDIIGTEARVPDYHIVSSPLDKC